MAESIDLIGIGYQFPWNYGVQGTVQLYSKEVDGYVAEIEESIRRIVMTPIGSRPMRRDFGSKIHDISFEILDGNTVSLAQHFIIDAVIRWEKRVIVRSVELTVDQAGARMDIDMRADIISIDTVANIVFPVYLNRGGRIVI